MRLSPFLVFAPLVPFALFAGSATAQPQLPSTVYGSASIDGRPVPDGTEVRGYIEGKDCTQTPGLRGTVTEGGASAFVINVMHESQSAGCGKEGKLITFTINGRPAPQAAAWKVGIQRFDLNIGSGQPPPLPSFTPSLPGATAGAATPGAAPTGPPPTDDVTFNRTPAPSGRGAPPPQSTGLDDGAPAGVVILAALGILAASGAIAGFILSRRNR